MEDRRWVLRAAWQVCGGRADDGRWAAGFCTPRTSLMLRVHVTGCGNPRTGLRTPCGGETATAVTTRAVWMLCAPAWQDGEPKSWPRVPDGREHHYGNAAGCECPGRCLSGGSSSGSALRSAAGLAILQLGSGYRWLGAIPGGVFCWHLRCFVRKSWAGGPMGGVSRWHTVLMWSGWFSRTSRHS